MNNKGLIGGIGTCSRATKSPIALQVNWAPQEDTGHVAHAWCRSFVSQSHHRINPHRPPRRNVTGKQGYPS
jgi:hypothetical protein